MKVLHVHSGNLYGGVETFLATLARCRQLAPAMEMSVALCFDGQIAAELRSENVPTALLGAVRMSRPRSVWQGRQAFARLLTHQRPDVVVCHQPWTQAIFGPVAKSASIPVVLWMHMMTNGHWLDRLAWRVPPDLVVCNSKFTASTLPVTSVRVEVVYYPALARSPKSSNSHVREALRTSPTDVVITQVSRMEPLKGQRICLEALAELRERDGWACWQIGGAQRPEEVRYFDSLRARAEQLGISHRVRFAGQRSDVPELLSASDIYCQPNLQPEAFGISFIEAMCAGLPVVTSNIGGAAEVVDPTTGLLVERGDPSALASALDRLIGDRSERVRLGGNGPCRVNELCNPVKQMSRIAEVLESAASTSSVAS